MRTTLLALLGATVAFMAADKVVQRLRHHEPVHIVVGHSDRTDRWDWRGAVATGKTLEIRGLNGSIRAEPASGSQILVTAEKHGGGDALANVRIEIVEHDGGVTVCAVYAGRGNTCRPGGGSMNVRGNSAEVSFVAHVPAGVAFKGASVSGDVQATGLVGAVDVNSVSGDVLVEDARGDVTAHSVSGDVTLTRVDGRDVTAETVSGDIQFSGPLHRGGSYQLKAVSGDLSVRADGGLSASVSISTLSGELESDFPVTLATGGRVRPRTFAFTVGGGDARLSLSTLSGAMYLRRGSRPE